jgi:hypothetical protein
LFSQKYPNASSGTAGKQAVLPTFVENGPSKHFAAAGFYKSLVETNLKQKNTYRIWTAIFLATLVLQVTLVRQVHMLMAHHQVAEHCLSFNGEHHIHSEEYAPADCQICLFHNAPAELNEQVRVLTAIPAANLRLPFFYITPSFRPVVWHAHKRGPPDSIA